MAIATIHLVGNLGNDPETGYTPNGRMNVKLSVAVSRRFNDSQGQQQERTAWYRVTAWGRLAENIDNLTQQGAVRKGSQVYVSGRLDPREYTDNTGQQKTSLDVNASEFQILGSRRDNEGGGGGYGGGGDRPQRQSPAGDFESNDIDDVPF